LLVLAVDSATPVAGVALVDENKVIKEEFINYKKTHSETLMPVIDRVFKECECGIDDLSVIAITIGPGSFTGLRIGMAAVKGLSLASGKPLVGVSTLDVLAHNISGSNALVCPLLDARKQEVYAAFYDVMGRYPKRLSELMACSPEDFVISALKTMESNKRDRVILLGDGYYPYRDYFQQVLGSKLLSIPIQLMLPKASALGSLGIEKAKQEKFEDVFKLRPIYIRLSEAEYRLGKGEL